MRLAVLLVLLSVAAEAQTVTGARFQLTTGPCTLRSGSGAPSSGLGAVCDIYHRTDSPYTVYVKTGGSTWTMVVAVDGVATGQVLASNGANVQPVFTASPSLTSIGGAANLTLNPTGDVVFDPTGNDLLPTTNYDLNIGSLTNRYLTGHFAELWTQTLVALDVMSTIGGRVLVGPTTTLTANLAAAGTTITVKHNQIANGDRLVLQTGTQIEWMAVTSAAGGSAGAYTYSVTRNLDGSGANDWISGDAVLNTGTTGDGYIDLYSVNGLIPGSTVGPTIVGNVRTGTTYSNIEPRWAIGNLNGLYGYAADTYGVALGSPSAAWVKIDPTNGVRIGHNATTSAQITASGAASFVTGDVTIDTDGIRISPETGGLTYVPGNSYGWSVGGTNAEMGISGTEQSGAQTMNVVNIIESGGKSATIAMTVGVTGSEVQAVLVSAEETALASTSLLFGNDLRIYTNNGSTTASPYIRSDGNYLVIESRSAANGGALYLLNDTNATLYANPGGGATVVGSSGATTTIYNASVNTSMILNGLVSCTLAVNGSSQVGCVSDAAAKTDVQRWRSGLDTVARLKPVSFKWKDGGDDGRHIGFLAQDVEAVIPDAVRWQPWAGGGLTLDDKAILAALVNAVQELQRRTR